MTNAVIAKKGPYSAEVEAGKTYYWCRCGRSQSQPFCDGSHKATDITPLKYVADENKKLFFCGCKRTARPPLCDGSHNKL
jgi:CDGSH-type Zn-finger protein